MKISQSSVDIHKNALYAIAVNSIQIVAAVVLIGLPQWRRPAQPLVAEPPKTAVPAEPRVN